MPQLTDDTTLVYDGYIWQKFRTLRMCQYCQHWDADNAVDGFACCDYMIYGVKRWLLAKRSYPVKGPAAIVKTHESFGCCYFMEREE